MPYNSISDLGVEVSSSNGDLTGKVQIVKQSQGCDYVYQLTTTVTATQLDLIAPIKSFTLNFKNLKFLVLKASAPVDISLTTNGVVPPAVVEDVWMPIPIRAIQMLLSKDDIVPAQHLKIRLNRSANTTPPTFATVEILLGGDLNP